MPSVLQQLAPAWSVVLDACPHRLAPLSQGRVDAATGCLECPYHGWQFDATGACTKIPQGTPDTTTKAGATTLPSMVCGDLIWAFFSAVQTGELVGAHLEAAEAEVEQHQPAELAARMAEAHRRFRALGHWWWVRSAVGFTYPDTRK